VLKHGGLRNVPRGVWRDKGTGTFADEIATHRYTVKIETG
jgi:hypothetical protein